MTDSVIAEFTTESSVANVIVDGIAVAVAQITPSGVGIQAVADTGRHHVESAQNHVDTRTTAEFGLGAICNRGAGMLARTNADACCPSWASEICGTHTDDHDEPHVRV